MLMPVRMGHKIDPAVVIVEADLLRNHGILVIPGHFHRCHQGRFFHGNFLEILHLVAFFLIININIPGIEVHRAVFVNHETVSGLACL